MLPETECQDVLNFLMYSFLVVIRWSFCWNPVVQHHLATAISYSLVSRITPPEGHEA